MLLNLPEDALGEALARVPLASHGALSTCCKQLRKIVKSDSFGALRRRLGWTEYGVFVLGAIFDMIDSECPDSDDAFFCLTHKLDVAQPPRLFYDAINVNICIASCEEKGVLVVSGHELKENTQALLHTECHEREGKNESVVVHRPDIGPRPVQDTPRNENQHGDDEGCH